MVGYLANGKLEANSNVTVRFAEYEANVGAICAKVMEALGQENMLLTDASGTRILDSEGTRGKFPTACLEILVSIWTQGVAR